MEDYADQRYYGSDKGGFWTADPAGMASVRLGNPGDWNRYAYSTGDPINFDDPGGTIGHCPPGTHAVYYGGAATNMACVADDAAAYGGGFGGTTPEPEDSCDNQRDPSPGCVYTGAGGDVGDDVTQAQEMNWMKEGLASLTRFSTKSKHCNDDLKAFGLNAKSIAATATTAHLSDYNALSKDNQKQYSPNADFSAAIQGGTKFIVFNASTFWQDSYSQMLGTLLHELIHLSNFTNYSLGDMAMHDYLNLPENKDDSTSISKKLANDCFSGARSLPANDLSAKCRSQEIFPKG